MYIKFCMAFSSGGNPVTLIVIFVVIGVVVYLGYRLFKGKKGGLLGAARGLFSGAQSIASAGSSLVEGSALETKRSQRMRAVTTDIGSGLASLKTKLENAKENANFGEDVRGEVAREVEVLGGKAASEKQDITQAKARLVEVAQELEHIEHALGPEKTSVARIEKMVIRVGKQAKQKGAGEITSVAVLISSAEALKTDLASIEGMIGSLKSNISESSSIIDKAKERLEMAMGQISEINSVLTAESEEVPLKRIEGMVSAIDDSLSSISALSENDSKFEELCVLSGQIMQTLGAAVQKLPRDAKKVRESVINVRGELKEHGASALEAAAAAE